MKDENNYSYLYRIQMNDDEVDDFVIVSSGGRSSCQSYYFLASKEGGYDLAPDVNYSRYSNEGKLCSSWGQDMYFVRDRYKKKMTYSVIRDIKTNGESFTLSLAPISESSKTAEMCKIKINVSSE